MRFRAPVGVVAIPLIAAALAACGGTAPTSVPAGTPTSAPTLTPTLRQSPSASGSAAVATPSASTSAASPTVAYDESLLSLLPSDIDGLSFEPDPDALAELDDKALGAAADRIAFAVISDVESGELAVTSVLHLKQGAFGDAFFRSYRDSYDAAACEPAGGKSGNAEAQIAGHQTFIGTCGSGAHTYHVYLPNQQTIVSIVSVGETRKFGERIVEGLRG